MKPKTDTTQFPFPNQALCVVDLSLVQHGGMVKDSRDGTRQSLYTRHVDLSVRQPDTAKHLTLDFVKD